MDPEYERLVAALRGAIARRDGLRPGTPDHWRASCEARTLMKRVAAAAGTSQVLPTGAVPAGRTPIAGPV